MCLQRGNCVKSSLCTFGREEPLLVPVTRTSDETEMCTSALLSLADSGLSLHHLDMLAFFLQTHMRARAPNLLLLGLTCLTLVHLTQSATRTYGSSCSSCNRGPSASFLGGQALGSNVRGVLGNKLEHIAGFFNGLGGGGGGGCGGCSSSCGSPGCGAHYVPAANPCVSGACYTSSCSSCTSSSSSSYSAPAHPSNTVTVIVQQPSISSSSSSHDASAYPNCQCSYLFNSHGQGNCNGQGARSYTSDRCNSEIWRK